MVALTIVPKTISIEEILSEDGSLDRSAIIVVYHIIILLWPWNSYTLNSKSSYESSFLLVICKIQRFLGTVIFLGMHLKQIINQLRHYHTRQMQYETLRKLTTGFRLTFVALFGLATFRSISTSKLCALENRWSKAVRLQRGQKM